MFRHTDSQWAPWHVAVSNDKKRARLKIIEHILSKVPHKANKQEKVKLPKRQKAKGYKAPDYPYKYV